ncbi:MAG: glutamate-5-semialdehyde dehydrogenase [SAR202 cluster bacterium]|nr:glutamate-5-semialdehyde dehydrogenase [SAR202 cluster bacterium]
MQTAIENLNAMGASARHSGRLLARVPSAVKDAALLRIADSLASRRDEVLSANEKDIANGKRDGLSAAVLGRLVLDAKKLEAMARDVRSVAALPDPTAETFDSRVLSNGLKVAKRRVPLGVLGVIYESRPNVTIDISALCLKSGNAVILRGGKEAIHSNTALARIVKESMTASGVPADAVQFIESTDRALVGHLLEMSEYIDLIIPRGGADLVRRVAAEAKMPAITGGVGVCHIYVDRVADIEKAVRIAFTAKTSAPYACNAVDTLLVHAAIAPAFLPKIAAEMSRGGVTLHCDRRALTVLGASAARNAKVAPATDADWGQEFLALTASVKIVDSIDEAIAHIDKFGSGHTEAIVTEDYTSANRFLDEVDSGVVVVNASTRFNDGAQLGLGAEVAISTNKMHARGPMGLKELTSYKWTVLGSGQSR